MGGFKDQGVELGGVGSTQSHIEIELRQRKFRMLGRHVIHVDFR